MYFDYLEMGIKTKQRVSDYATEIPTESENPKDVLHKSGIIRWVFTYPFPAWVSLEIRSWVNVLFRKWGNVSKEDRLPRLGSGVWGLWSLFLDLRVLFARCFVCSNSRHYLCSHYNRLPFPLAEDNNTILRNINLWCRISVHNDFEDLNIYFLKTIIFFKRKTSCTSVSTFIIDERTFDWRRCIYFGTNLQ